LVFVAVALAFFYPVVFENKTMQRYDNIQSEGMQAEMRKVAEETGTLPLWTNSMFSGMPTYQILYKSDNVLEKPFKLFLWGNGMAPPHTAMILVMLGVYILLLTMKVDWKLSMAGAVCFMLGTNFMDLIITGHATKVIALGYLAPTLAGVLLAFRGKYLLGGAMAAFFMGMELWANHVQVTYYFLLTLVCFGFVALYRSVKNGTLANFGKASATVIVAFLLAFATNTGRLWSTYEFSAETIRGKSELSEGILSENSNVSSKGMSKSYAFSWSLGKLETFTLLVPKFMGETSGKNYLNQRGSEAIRVLQNSPTMRQVPQAQQQQIFQQLAQYTSYYWGNQPFVGGPFYFGAIVLLLFFMGAFLVKSRAKWWLISGAILMVMVSWGRHFPILNYTFYDYLPMFNKFRAVTTSLSVGWLMVLTLGFWGLKEFFDANRSAEEKRKALFYGAGIVGVLLLVALFISFGMVELMPAEKMADLRALAAENQGAQLMLQLVEEMQPALEADRGSFMRGDIFRSFLYVALAFGAMFFFVKQDSKPKYLIYIVLALAVLDLGGVAKRYFNENTFINKQQNQEVVAPTPADQQILQDPDPHYRVFDSQRGGFSSSIASFHHKSVGGYNAAKLMRYQELIEKYLNNPGAYPHIYDMLNTKYFVNGGRPVRNPNALGNAWFVNSYEIVEDGDAEFLGLADLKPGEKALVQKKFAAPLEGLNIKVDSSATIKLTSYHPDRMEYEYSANSEQLAVFSEIYYPSEKGWKLYLDGEEIDLIKANYLLRAARLPAKQNGKLEMVFEPKSYYTGETISLIASLIVLLAFLIMVGWQFKKNLLDENEPTTDSTNEKEKLKPTTAKTTATKNKVRKKKR
jgi:hypothetical protein